MSKIVIPSAPAELEDMLSDPKQVATLTKEGQFGDFMSAYARVFMGRHPDFGTLVREESQRVMAEMLRDGSAKPTAPLDLDVFKAPSRNGKYNKIRNPRAAGAALDGVFDSSSSFFQAVWQQNHPSGHLADEYQEPMRKVLNYQEKVPSQGGFLVPEEFRSELLRLALESSIVRPRARVIPMSSQSIRFPMIDSTSNVSSVFGGVVVYRTEEGAELVESTGAFGTIKLDATKQTALAHVTNELVRDWAAFGIYIDEIFPEAMAWFEDVDFISGNGVGAPLGGLSLANLALIAIAAENGQVAGTIVWENIVKMYARMLPTSLSRAVWMASPDTFAELATMALSVGTGGSAIWLTNGTDAPSLYLLGRPVIMTEKAPAALGTQGDLSFVDWGMYLVGDRQEMTVDVSPHVKFTSDKTTYRVISRNDGRPWLQSPITPHNSSATLSPFIQLATR